MKKKQFKAESKKLLDMMINSIYTHKEIFLRELISNASDAIDKRYYHSLSDSTQGLAREDYKIQLFINKDAKTLTIVDNGCGMSVEELESNLGTIAKSGSLDFKSNNEKQDDVEIIGQFGVGFYSAFMVSDEVTVKTRTANDETGHCWVSQGADGYTISECEKAEIGTEIVLHIKENTEQDSYNQYLETYTIQSLVKKYSDYIRYPIMLDVETRQLKEGSEDEYETVLEAKQLNSMVPLWRKNKNEITDEEYKSFYMDKFHDYTAPLHIIHSKTEGQVSYDAMLFIPEKTPWDFYSKDFEKGLQLYSNGVMIMDKCSDLLPDYFGFVKGIVDSPDLSLNISREMLQHDYQLKLIAKNIEKKIKSELSKMLKNDRDKYITFFEAFGSQIKLGVYADFGRHAADLKDLLMFWSSTEKRLVTLQEYVDRMPSEQTSILYACGETFDKIDMLPQADSLKDKGYEVLYLTEGIDEFVLKMLQTYAEKSFANICADDIDLDTQEEKEAIKQENESAKELLDFMSETLGDSVEAVRFTNKLKNHPVCLTSEGDVSIEMEKVLSSIPGEDSQVKAKIVLEINSEHPVADKLKSLYETDKEKIADYAKILYSSARLIGGMPVENPTELSNLICNLMI
ncbi:MAG: molecular chaperone HtpG [Clostridia bacterium]|nr:molecular chaperone HtpG [Clostridia bacterium]